jgi:hypothetical protein
VLSNGLWDYNANGYLATMHSYLFNGSTQDRTGAAFIILTQLGYQYGSSKSVAVAQSIWGTYDNAIHYLDSHGQIDWNATPSLSCGQANTYFQNSVGADDSAFIMDTSNSTCGTNRASIGFTLSAGAGTYYVARLCGNPINFNHLPIPSNFIIDATIVPESGTPGNLGTLNVNNTYHLNPTLKNTGDASAPVLSVVMQLPSYVTFVSNDNTHGFTYNAAARTITWPLSGLGAGLTWNGFPFSFSVNSNASGQTLKFVETVTPKTWVDGVVSGSATDSIQYSVGSGPTVSPTPTPTPCKSNCGSPTPTPTPCQSNCGNPTPTPVPTPVPGNCVPTIGTVTPALADRNAPFNFSWTINTAITGDYGTATVSGNVAVRIPGGSNSSLTDFSGGVTAAQPSFTKAVSQTLLFTSIYTITATCSWTGSGAPGNTGGSNPVVTPPSNEFKVIVYRYPGLLGLGSDINGDGGIVDSSSKCSVLSSPAGIIGNGKNTYGMYVLSAAGSISNFGSNNSINGNAASLGSNGGYYSGSQTTACRPNLADPARVPGPLGSYISVPGPLSLTGLAAGIYYYSGGGTLTITGNYSSRITIVSESNVTISGDITASAVSAIGRNQPSLGIIAKGNINIVGPVIGSASRVDAYMFSNGTIDTCSSGNCASTLDVNGFLMAKSIMFHRTGVDDGYSATTSAEKVIMTGQLFINPPELFQIPATSILLTQQNELPPLK